jgi:hypothetical protein
VRNFELSVVVPFVNEASDLARCLDALAVNAADTPLEVIVVNRVGPVAHEVVHAHMPAAVVVDVDRRETIPEMRARAFDRSSAPAVAVIEDHVIVRPGWARQMVAAIAAGDRVAAGAIENGATDTLIVWAAFLCEYSHCLPPLPAGPAEWLTGNNVVYPRALLERFKSATHEGQWENHLHGVLRQHGIPLVCHPEIVVDHRKHYTFGEYFSQRYLYSRSYAGARVAGASIAKRMAFAVAALALPPVLFYRTVTRISSKGRHRDWLLKSVPLIGLFTIAWAWGEAVGAALGPGDSLSHVC